MKIFTLLKRSIVCRSRSKYFGWRYAASLFYQYTYLYCLVTLLVTSGPLYAVVSADGTLNTSVTQVVNDYVITGGTQNNTNLFHSFSNFDLVAGESATFNGAASITNIIGRVTSGQASSIDGQINSGITGANLWLVNPAGVVFGSNASLNVSGSFHVSTADYLVLGAQEGRFDASNPGATVLSTAPPSAFGFLDNTVAPINFNGSNLRLDAGKTMSVIAGNIEILDASLSASGGTINVVAVASAGEVLLNANGIDTSSINNFGNISVTQTTFITGRPMDASFRPLANIDASGDSGGKIYIRSGRFEMDNGYVFSDTHETGTGGLVDIVSDTVALTKEARITTDTGNKGGSGGDINITADTVSLTQGAQLSVSSYGSGDAGTVTIDAETSVILDDKSPDEPHLFAGVTGTPRESAITSEAYSTGSGGDINISTGLLQLNNESLISAVTSREGHAGNITLAINDLQVLSGSAINSSTFGEGNGGTISINASAAVLVSGAVTSNDIANPWIESGVLTNSYSSGDGGNIDVTASDITISDRGVIQANLGDDPTFLQPAPDSTRLAGNIGITTTDITFSSGGQITSLNTAGGVSGTIKINSENISISGQANDASQVSGIFSTTTSADNSGIIDLNTHQLVMSDNGTINTSTTSAGDAGSIQIATSDVSVTQGARISSSTGSTGDGGSISVQADGDVLISGTGSDGFSSGLYTVAQVSAGQVASDVSGNGGAITLSSGQLTLSDNGVISARSEGTGAAGQISLAVETGIEMYSNSSISTEALNGGGGKINIVASDLLRLDDASISSSVADGSGNGGDINIDPVFITLQNGSSITANAFAGNGGNINMVANYYFESSDSLVQASSQFGLDGNIEINSPDTDVSGSLTDLPTDFLNASALLKSKCAARSENSQSSLIVRGRGGIRPSPADLIGVSPLSEFDAAPGTSVIKNGDIFHVKSDGCIG